MRDEGLHLTNPIPHSKIQTDHFMAFDPTKPVAELAAGRGGNAQPTNGLNDLIAARAPRVDGVDELAVPVNDPPQQAEVMALARQIE